LRSSVQRSSSAVAAICDNEATTVQARKLGVIPGNARPGVSASQTTSR
jgi:hypothetical protein